jgi:hypothetical protein
MMNGEDIDPVGVRVESGASWEIKNPPDVVLKNIPVDATMMMLSASFTRDNMILIDLTDLGRETDRDGWCIYFLIDSLKHS